MGLISDWTPQRKEPVNVKTVQQKSFELEHRVIKDWQCKQSLNDLQYSITHSNTHVLESQKMKENGTEKILTKPSFLMIGHKF